MEYCKNCKQSANSSAFICPASNTTDARHEWVQLVWDNEGETIMGLYLKIKELEAHIKFLTERLDERPDPPEKEEWSKETYIKESEVGR